MHACMHIYEVMMHMNTMLGPIHACMYAHTWVMMHMHTMLGLIHACMYTHT